MTGRAMAARSDETGTGSAEGNSAVANGDGPKITGDNPMTDTTNNAWEGPAYEYGVTWGPDAVDTTDQQAVTVAQEDREAFDELYGDIETHLSDRDCDIVVQHLARRRLTSVSSAGSEGWKLVPTWPTLAMLQAGGDCYGDSMTSDVWSAMLAASPEPVPATNQAGEVAKALPKLKPGYPDYVDDPDGLDRFRQQVRRESGHDMAVCNNNSLGRLLDTIERLRAERDVALATQPATSQPEETWMNDPLSLDAGLPEMSQEAMALICAMAEYSPHVMQAQHGKTVCDDYARAAIIAVTPTPPTLSEDLREAFDERAGELFMANGGKHSSNRATAWQLFQEFAALAQVKAS